ncbi:RDD family protein [Nonomuraea sp. NPDC052129]|uniref:RDD family protein n=1 Tax=Nonomuraea sp. NPDC052129 TaxID=3154651 RepID=UPI003443D10C
MPNELGKTQGGRAKLRPRLVAADWDYLVIVGWLALLAVVFVPLRLAGVRPFDGLGTVGGDLLITALTVLPVGAYLIIGEAGRHQATWGKRRAGLAVVTTRGARPGAARIVMRNAVKVLPWQCGHMGHRTQPARAPERGRRSSGTWRRGVLPPWVPGAAGS